MKCLAELRDEASRYAAQGGAQDALGVDVADLQARHELRLRLVDEPGPRAGHPSRRRRAVDLERCADLIDVHAVREGIAQKAAIPVRQPLERSAKGTFELRAASSFQVDGLGAGTGVDDGVEEAVVGGLLAGL